MGAIVMDGAHIGERSLVAAGALVSPGTIIPPRSLVLGVPARVKRPLTGEEVAGLDVYWQNYIEYTRQYKSDE
jgi:carbonic anhydrase/acetyltransferase-like protein (isoleucine patch superfamily)